MMFLSYFDVSLPRLLSSFLSKINNNNFRNTFRRPSAAHLGSSQADFALGVGQRWKLRCVTVNISACYNSKRNRHLHQRQGSGECQLSLLHAEQHGIRALRAPRRAGTGPLGRRANPGTHATFALAFSSLQLALSSEDRLRGPACEMCPPHCRAGVWRANQRTLRCAVPGPAS